MGVFERETLPNGLRLLTANIPTSQSIACFVMLAAGSRYETRETNGIAHFAEHMFFKGTERRPTARDIGSEIDGIGGEFNAFTGKEYTGYYVRCAAEHRHLATDVLIDMLRHSKFEPEEIDREKGVIVEEMNMYFDTPRDYIGGVYDALLYDDQPLGWDIIGRKETVRAATRETFTDYIGRWYKPERMVVGFGGKIDGDARAEVLELLGDLEPADTGAPPPVELRANGGPRVKLHTKDSDQAHLTLGVRSYPLIHPDRYAVQVLATVLGTGMSSRLFTEVRERRGLAYYVFAANHAYTDAGSLYSQAGVDINRVDEAVRRSSASSSGSSTRPCPPTSSRRQRTSPRGASSSSSRARTRPSSSGCAGRCSRAARRSPRRFCRASTRVTAEDVQRVAQDVIGSNGLNLALIGPFDDEERFHKLLA
jgi:predicted Zn-dependent peptidase